MQYSLRDPAQTYSWDPTTDLAIDTSATCTLQSDVYQIFASSIEVPPDSTMFTYTPGANEFLINYTEDVQVVGTYEIWIRFTVVEALANYGLVEMIDPILIHIFDPCDSPSSLTGTPQSSVTYYVLDPTATVTVTPFTSDPSWCDITYSCDLITGGLQSIASWNSLTNELSFQTNDLMASKTQHPYS